MDETFSTPPSVAPKKSGQKVFWWIILLLILVAAVIYLLPSVGVDLTGVTQPTTTTYSKGDWQAIFLDNGQVYFGKVENDTTDPVILNEIYYLQVIQPLQQVEEGQTPARPAQPQLSLVKLGNELHAPVDSMRINRSHIIFVEDLKPEGRVVGAIMDYKNQAAQQQAK